MKKRFYFLLVLVFSLLLPGVASHPVLAQNPTGYSCQVTEQKGRITTLDCAPGYATEHDRLVIHGDVPVGWGAPGSSVTWLPDIQDGAVVFDVQADNRANLVIVFSQDADGALVAKIYDDQDGDGSVSTRRGTAGELNVIEPGPTVSVVAPDGWWQKGEKVNFNLDIAVDGPVRACFYGFLENFQRLDGKYEIEARIRDPDGDGLPDYEWRQIYFPLDEPSAYHHTELVVNTEDDEASITGAFLWPYLGDTLSSMNQYGKVSYTSSPPPIDVDWSVSRVTHVGEFVGSRTEPGNYFVYSFERLEEGQVTAADFENPFAFYDLSGGNEPLPDLLIRNAYFRPRDSFFPSGGPPFAVNDVFYAWRYPSGELEELPSWDYKISLVGTYEYKSIVKVGDLSFASVEYEQYPYWVTDKTWDMATFVASEGAREQNSEGIAAWGAILEYLAYESYYYVSGWLDELPLDRFETIPEGFRGEVAPTLDAQPWLYISSVDGKLHLAGASSGVWAVRENSELRYANLDGDPYLDQWLYVVDDQVQSQLDLADDYLIFAGDGRLRLKQTQVLPVLFESLPPRNHQEWSEMGDQLASHRRQFAPQDLEAMLAQFSGAESDIEGASLRDYRHTDGGFRFILTLDAGSSFENVDWLDAQFRTEGEYVVTYDAGEFSVEPFEPANPILVSPSVEMQDQTAVTTQSILVRAVLRNDGLQDLLDLPVSLYVQGPDGQKVLAEQKVIPLLAAQDAEVSYAWSPPEAGEWALWLALDRGGEEQLLADSRLVVTVEPAPEPEQRWYWGQSRRSVWIVPVFALALMVVAIALVLQLTGYLTRRTVE